MTETKISKAQQKAVNKYVKNNYDRINVTFPKGFRDILKEKSQAAGQSVNEYIKQAVQHRIDTETISPQQTSHENNHLSPDL